MTTDPVTRAEFAMLSAQVAENRRSVEHIDETGTRGVAVLSSQMTEVIKDVGNLQTDFKDHLKAHETEELARKNSRRWAIGAAIGALAAVAAILTLLIDISSKVH